MTVDAALEFVADVRAAARSLEMLRDVGLGHLRLGQPATERSGGEARRIELATQLQRGRRGHALYLLDERTTGLHAADIEPDAAAAPARGLGHHGCLVEHDRPSCRPRPRPGARLRGRSVELPAMTRCMLVSGHQRAPRTM
jgi:excinuclease ABC subunit A